MSANQKIKYLYRARDGRWKYMRDVPRSMQKLLGRARWEYSLGSDYMAALKRWVKLNEKHDTLVASLKTAEGKQTYQEKSENEDAARLLQLMAHIGFPTSIDRQVEVWRSTESIMSQARSSDPDKEWQRLAQFAAYAFGDKTHIAQSEFDDPFGATLSELLTPSMPDDPVSAGMFNAYKSVLEKRLAELSINVSPDDPLRLSNYIKTYLNFKASRPSTRKSHTDKVNTFIGAVGDLRITEITREHIQTYRDTLIKRMEVSSAKGYLAPIKALLSHAFDEKKIIMNPAMGIKMPTDPKNIEDRKHLPFTVDEVRMILDLANEVWADENTKSRLSLARRQLYRLTIKALFHTGARPHELWRLSESDVGIFTDKNWPHLGIDIRKTKEGVRLIPCPDAVSEFADFVQNGGLKCLSENGTEDPTDEKVAQMVKAFSGERQFNKILETLKIKRERLSLYSTRATFVTALQRNECNDSMIESIIGHVGSAKMLRHYKSKTEMSDMLAAMNNVSY